MGFDPRDAATRLCRKKVFHATRMSRQDPPVSPAPVRRQPASLLPNLAIREPKTSVRAATKSVNMLPHSELQTRTFFRAGDATEAIRAHASTRLVSSQLSTSQTWTPPASFWGRGLGGGGRKPAASFDKGKARESHFAHDAMRSAAMNRTEYLLRRLGLGCLRAARRPAADLHRLARSSPAIRRGFISALAPAPKPSNASVKNSA